VGLAKKCAPEKTQSVPPDTIADIYDGEYDIQGKAGFVEILRIDRGDNRSCGIGAVRKHYYTVGKCCRRGDAGGTAVGFE